MLDVRDIETFRKGHIQGAQHVSMRNISSVINGSEKKAPVVIYCYRGFASREYAQMFSDFGFLEVYSLDGGYEAWRNSRDTTSGREDKSLQWWLAEHGFPVDDVNSIIANNTTPLMKASHLGDSEIVRNLIAAGARIDAQNTDGNTALWLACVGGHLNIIDMLADAGVDINNRNDNGATALMYASSASKADVVARLLEKGADITAETLDGFTAIDMAATIECLELLRNARKTLAVRA
ncbi:ankyrin repeat domain-containing protein [Hyphomicrobium sp. 802]|uniref:ankyrin repeat domain-containing protein n=1 Tax=Hyphomicrobium sp. 802 TaxID=1112272 RepID=UPI001FD9C382|nr:ankyrin repeat domain-containing protein [Hyphomicrobium sp. 802]